MARVVSRRTSQTLLFLLALFLLGTVAFLWAVRSYFSIDTEAIIRAEELGTWEEIQLGAPDSALSWKTRYPWLAKALSLKPEETVTLDAKKEAEFSDAIAKHAAEAAKAAGFGDDGIGYIPTGRNNTPKAWDPINDPPEKVPRIIHQTWKEKTLPPHWQAVRDECARMHPDYEYMLWTDADSRQFLVENYSWFVPIFDAYPYAIQRADAIRYFILYHHGGIYMDLDVGCLRRLDPLLRFEVVLPVTIPVGVSNDVMVSAKRHPFMDHLVHNLVTFNHRYLTHYPTVMFSTGPMFVSASLGLYVDAHGPATPSTPSNPSAGFSGIRVLPKSLYGKNAKPSEAPDAFFRHFYGSSWHEGDAGFLIFLREHGRFLIFIGFIVVMYGFGRTFANRILSAFNGRSDRRRRSSRRTGRWISLPFVRDPRSGRYRSLSREYYPDTASKSFSDEGTQTNSSPSAVSASAAASALASSSRLTEVAAPRPQRAGMPLFELHEGDNTAGDDEEIDLGPGLNREANAKGPASGGILNWMGLPSSTTTGGESSSRSQSSMSLGINSEIVPPSSAGSESLNRSGSASKYKDKNGVLYLPAYLVAGSSSSAASSTTDSALASIRATDDESVRSPTESISSSGPASVPPWMLTRPHARSNSSTPGSAWGNWAASFLGSSSGGQGGSNAPLDDGQHASGSGGMSTLQKMWDGVNIAARTPSPSLFLSSTFRGRSDEQHHLRDIESTGSSDLPLSRSKSVRMPREEPPSFTRSASSTGAVAGRQDGETRISLRKSPSVTNLRNSEAEKQSLLTASTSGDSLQADEEVIINLNDHPPPYDHIRAPSATGPSLLPGSSTEPVSQPYTDADSDEQTPTLGARRILGRQQL